MWRLGSDGVTGFRKTRRQWKALLTLEHPAVVRSKVAVVGPDPANVLRRIAKENYIQGTDRPELHDLAGMSRTFKDRVGYAGTPTPDLIP